jgi:hypothetical protein
MPLPEGTPESPKRDVISLLGALRPSNAVLLGEQSAYIPPNHARVLNSESLLKAGDDDNNKEEKLVLKL